MPFVIADLKEYDCHHGKDHNISKKNKAKIEKVMLVFLLSFFCTSTCNDIFFIVP